ncbi:type VI secretion system amidase effector protein Tae4 [Pseudomonas sp. NPDC088368]|uniref:type VI secretion system amidase effector protein Tae4 n=1 Tax=Pseudomonas sp. NPDC088368 TaxID=3364453 RepID=UPI003820B0E4
MAKPSFINLWNAYERLMADHPAGDPCDGSWVNQCAIRMSITLNAEHTIKVNKFTYSEPKCAHEHARGAESLANWLWKNQLGRPAIYTNGASDRDKILNKVGIIFFKDFFYQPNDAEGHPSGDHIDLWDRGITATRGSDYFHRSKSVWFWELA